jgi:uncharacterized repeat protein (TIGR01451 family)
MKYGLPKYILLAIGAMLLMLAGAMAGTTGTAAAPLMAITNTAEPPSRTPTARPTRTPLPGATRTPGPTPTRAPSSKPDLADPAITKSSSVSDAKIGDEITFTIRVTNNGPHTAEDVVVTDPIPDYLDVIEATTTRGDVSSNGRTVIVTIGKVPAGDVVTIRIRVRVNERAAPPGGRNSVSLTTSSPGDDPSNNSSEVTFNIVGPATPTVPALTPTATLVASPVVPAVLPPTGAAEDSSSHALLLAALGMAALLLSLLFRGKARE